MDFERLDFARKAEIDALTARYGEGSCQHSFVAMYTLQEKYGDAACLADGTLYVRREKLCTDELSVYLMPLGEADPARSVGQLLEDAHARGTRLRFFTATERAAETLRRAFPGRFAYEEERDYAEYFLLTQKLAELPKAELFGKRRSVRRFFRDCPGTPSITDLTADDLDDVLSFHRAWVAENMESHDAESLLRETRTVQLQLEHFAQLRLRGLCVRVDGAVRGYCYGNALSEEVFDGIAMKGDRSVPNINALMYHELGKRCGCRYLNAEEDLGIPGLRESKLSYKPERLLKKFVVTEVDA